jgi:hypothetical protein
MFLDGIIYWNYYGDRASKGYQAFRDIELRAHPPAPCLLSCKYEGEHIDYIMYEIPDRYREKEKGHITITVASTKFTLRSCCGRLNFVRPLVPTSLNLKIRLQRKDN